MSALLRLQRLAGNQAVTRQLREQDDGGPCVQRLTDLVKGQIESAILYTDRALAQQSPGTTWATVVGRLTGAEKTELSELWRTKTGGKKTAIARTKAGVAVATRALVMLGTLTDQVAYINNFDTKHVTEALTPRSGVVLGMGRDVKPRWSTVFSKAGFAEALFGAASGKADGDHVWRGRASDLGPTKIALAEWVQKDLKYVQAELGIYMFDVHYSVATDAPNRTRKVTASHLETA